ncbi:MAG: hypothetical protein METHAR1v1_1680045 [Methanothrix sp.]|nr:MAG: hypothetical protein METHAR1v1_1680045 [Methanothrix sp.]
MRDEWRETSGRDGRGDTAGEIQRLKDGIREAALERRH